MAKDGELIKYQSIMRQTNKEFSIVVTFVPVYTMKQEEYIFLADEFSFEPKASDENSGTGYNCDQEIVISRPDSSILQKFSIFRSGTLYFRDTSGKRYVIGSDTVPARICISPHLNLAKLNIKCTMLKSPLL